MAKTHVESGNKMSMRASAFDQIKRIDAISNSLGTLGDLLVSTKKSLMLSIVALAVPTFIGFFMAYNSNVKNLVHNAIPLTLIVIGALITALNTMLVNPSKGPQLIVSFKYWSDSIKDNSMNILTKETPFRFYKNSMDRSVLESMWDGHKHYTAVIKVQGNVSRTSFDEDLVTLESINKTSLESMDRHTIRTTINFIGTPKTQQKKVAKNGTPEMHYRSAELYRTIKSLGDMQTLETYIILDNRNPRRLQNAINNQFTYFQRGLVVTAHIVKDEELKKTMRLLFA